MLSNHPNVLGGNGPSASSDLIGDVDGPASATDNAVARFDGTTGKLIQNSTVTIADSTGAIAGASSLTSPASTNLTLAAGGTNQSVVLTPSGTGGVGIGTTSPSGFADAKVLDVFQSTPAQAQVIVEGGNGANFVQITSGTSTASGNSGGSIITNNDLRFAIATAKDATGYSEKMRIKSGGDITISSSTAGSSSAGALVVTGGLSAGNNGNASYFGGDIAGKKLVLDVLGEQLTMTRTGIGTAVLAVGGSAELYGKAASYAFYNAAGSSIYSTISSTGLAISSGLALTLGNAYVATPVVSTGYVTIKDVNGTTYKVAVSL